MQQGTQLFTSHLDAQALPLIQEPRFGGGGSLASGNCGHGPSFGGGAQDASSVQNYNVAAGYETGKSNHYEQSFDSNQNSVSTDFATNLVSSYEPPASGAIGQNSLSINVIEHSPTSSYGPPPSGNPGDSVAYDTQVKTASVSLSEDSNNQQQQPQALALVQEVQSNSEQEQTSTKEENIQIHSEENQISSNEQSSNHLVGLDGSGLDIISAQKSHSLTIPVQGSLGTYQLQFQAADPLGGSGNDLDAPNHQQILSEGLLQSILSAIEQPGSSSVAVPQSTFDELQAHSEVDNFIKSQAGQEVLLEQQPKIE